MFYQIKTLKMRIYIGFRKVNTSLLTAHLTVLETNVRANSRALQYWNIAFKEP